LHREGIPCFWSGGLVAATRAFVALSPSETSIATARRRHTNDGAAEAGTGRGLNPSAQSFPNHRDIQEN